MQRDYYFCFNQKGPIFSTRGIPMTSCWSITLKKNCKKHSFKFRKQWVPENLPRVIKKKYSQGFKFPSVGQPKVDPWLPDRATQFFLIMSLYYLCRATKMSCRATLNLYWLSESAIGFQNECKTLTLKYC